MTEMKTAMCVISGMLRVKQKSKLLVKNGWGILAAETSISSPSSRLEWRYTLVRHGDFLAPETSLQGWKNDNFNESLYRIGKEYKDESTKVISLVEIIKTNEKEFANISKFR